MVDEILKASGIPYRQARFTGKLPDTYIVYFDDLETDGADGVPALIVRHDVSVELYENRPDDKSEAALEAAISAAGLQWVKNDREWIQTEQLYQVVYDFEFTEKRRA